MKLQTFHDLFILKLKALYDIELVLIKELPKLAKEATDPELKTAFKNHHSETLNHRKRLERAFASIKVKPAKTKVEGIRGLKADTQWMLKQDMAPEICDMALISSAQYVEHYEMAGYRSAILLAGAMGHSEAGSLLEETLSEEEASDELLTTIAERLSESYEDEESE